MLVNLPTSQGRQDKEPNPELKKPGTHNEHGAFPVGLELPGLQDWAAEGPAKHRIARHAKSNLSFNVAYLRLCRMMSSGGQPR
jgi:hypothetical protein